MKGHSRLNTPSKDVYQDLVRRPDFVAGVLDGRAMPYQLKHPDESFSDGFWLSEQINITSENRPLLEALRDEFGGAVVTEPTSNHWQLGKRNIRKLQPQIQEHLLLIQVNEGRLVRQ